MRLLQKAILLMMSMLVSAGLASILRPTIYTAEQGPKVNLEQLIPRQFGDWRELQHSTAQIINPQQAETLGRIYSQTLSRTYFDSQHRVIMLSIAYGVDQSRDSQLHRPETCYPAQGFDLKFTRPAILSTNFGDLKTAQMFAVLGARQEPITYWMRVGDSVLRAGTSQSMQRLHLGLFKNAIPDGLLFRVSNISGDTEASFLRHEAFVRDLLEAASPELRLALIGPLK